MFAALGKLDDDVDINTTCWSIGEASATGPYKMKQHKPWLEKRCSKLLYQRKQAELHWFKNPRRTKRYNLNDVRREASTTFRNKSREYLKERKNSKQTARKNIRLTKRHKWI
jgi:hypothetical protein